VARARTPPYRALRSVKPAGVSPSWDGYAIILVVMEEKRAAARLTRHSLRVVAAAGILAVGAGAALATAFGVAGAISAICFIVVAALVATRP
jgi:hypothetical protein